MRSGMDVVEISSSNADRAIVTICASSAPDSFGKEIKLPSADRAPERRKRNYICSSSTSDLSGRGLVPSSNRAPRRKRDYMDSTSAGPRRFRGEGYVYCHGCRMYAEIKNAVPCSQCPSKFCWSCLEHKHGEIGSEQMEPNVFWVCPACRGGCGDGCKTCCICSKCRRPKGLLPVYSKGTKYKATMAAEGFSNIHDYVVHLETGESADKIATRKISQAWTKAGRKISIQGVQDFGIHNLVTSYESSLPGNAIVKSENLGVSCSWIYAFRSWFTRDISLSGSTVTMILSDSEVQKVMATEEKPTAKPIKKNHVKVAQMNENSLVPKLKSLCPPTEAVCKEFMDLLLEEFEQIHKGLRDAI